MSQQVSPSPALEPDRYDLVAFVDSGRVYMQPPVGPVTYRQIYAASDHRAAVVQQVDSREFKVFDLYRQQAWSFVSQPRAVSFALWFLRD